LEGYERVLEKMNDAEEAAARLVLPAALLLDTEGQQEDEDNSVLYFYPDTDSIEELAHETKGMLLAMKGMSKSIVGERVQVVCLEHFESDQKLLASYVHLGSVLLVLLLPAKLRAFLATCVAEDCAQLLAFALGPSWQWWGAGEDCASGDEEAPQTPHFRRLRRPGEPKILSGWARSRLELVLQSYFMEIRGREWLHAHVVPAFELGVPYAAVALDLQLSALELLNGIEVVCPPAEERAASPAMFRMSRSSCLIHSGKLIASHMDVRETKEVWRLCWALSMFERTADHPPAVLMEDAYLPDAAAGPSAPARGEAGLPETPSAAGPSPSSGGSGGHGRVSLLIVGIGEDIVVVMLRPLGGAGASDLRGSFLVDAVTHDLSRFREEESAALAGLAARSEDAAAADAGAPPPQPGPAAALRAPRPAPEDTMLLHHISYNGVSGVLLATDSPPGELASNLAGDFVATAVQLHSLLERLRQSAFHTHHLSQASRGDLTPSAHGSPFSPFSNSPGPMWESIGTPRSARISQFVTDCQGCGIARNPLPNVPCLGKRLQKHET